MQYIRTRSSIFSQWPDAKRVFLPGGEVPKVGDLFVQADLAKTLREIVRAEKLARGTRANRHAGLMAARDYFYKGPIAKRIGDYMQANGGLIAAEHLVESIGPGHQITLVAPNRRFTFYPALVQLAFGECKPEDISFDLAAKLTELAVLAEHQIGVR